MAIDRQIFFNFLFLDQRSGYRCEALFMAFRFRFIPFRWRFCYRSDRKNYYEYRITHKLELIKPKYEYAHAKSAPMTTQLP